MIIMIRKYRGVSVIHTIRELIENKSVLILGYGREGRSSWQRIKEAGSYSRIAIADMNHVQLEEGHPAELICGPDYQKCLLFRQPDGIVHNVDDDVVVVRRICLCRCGIELDVFAEHAEQDAVFTVPPDEIPLAVALGRAIDFSIIRMAAVREHAELLQELATFLRRQIRLHHREHRYDDGKKLDAIEFIRRMGRYEDAFYQICILITTHHHRKPIRKRIFIRHGMLERIWLYLPELDGVLIEDFCRYLIVPGSEYVFCHADIIDRLGIFFRLRYFFRNLRCFFLHGRLHRWP